MHKKILLGCCEVPGYGGGSTAAYALFEMMQRAGMDVSYVNLIEEGDADYYRYAFGRTFGNPKGLANVHNCILDHAPCYPSPQHARLSELIQTLAPDTLVGVGFVAALLMKRSAPDRRLVFLTHGCAQAKNYLTARRARDAIALSKLLQRTPNCPEYSNDHERQAVELSDLILTHSDMTRSFFQHFFSLHAGKIYPDVIWFAEWIYHDALDYADLRKPFSKRDVDLVFVASIWERPEKNLAMLQQILSRCRGLNIHVVGEIQDIPAAAVCHGLIARRHDLFALLGRAKTLVCPSLLDTAPGILFEACALGCNVVASKNCGNWRVCNDDLLVDPFTTNGFVEKIRLSLTHEFTNNITYYLAAESWRNLVEILSVF